MTSLLHPRRGRSVSRLRRRLRHIYAREKLFAALRRTIRGRKKTVRGSSPSISLSHVNTAPTRLCLPYGYLMVRSAAQPRVSNHVSRQCVRSSFETRLTPLLRMRLREVRCATFLRMREKAEVSRPIRAASPAFVTAGLDPAVHTALPHGRSRRMDARVKPAHDDGEKMRRRGLARPRLAHPFEPVLLALWTVPH